jgi:hypothetical protein
MSPQSGPCVRSVSESNISGRGSSSSIYYNETSNNTTTSWDDLTLDSSTLPLPPKQGRYNIKLPPYDIYPPPPGMLQRAPSQATMHFTTVPQSLVSRNIGSRHHPTRSSLRHSRMLVMTKEGKGNDSREGVSH